MPDVRALICLDGSTSVVEPRIPRHLSIVSFFHFAFATAANGIIETADNLPVKGATCSSHHIEPDVGGVEAQPGRDGRIHLVPTEPRRSTRGGGPHDDGDPAKLAFER